MTNPSGTILDQIPATYLKTNESYGRKTNGGIALGLLNSSTPNSSNDGIGIKTIINLSHNESFYDHPFYLKINCQDSVYYTTNGSDPTLNSSLFIDSVYISNARPNNISLIPTSVTDLFSPPIINIAKCLPLKFTSFKNGIKTSNLLTKSYFTTKNKSKLPIISIITDSLNLFDYNTGVYIPGVHFDQNNIFTSGNCFERGINWEKPANFEYFDSDKNLKFSEPIGVRIAKNSTRKYPQKSLRIYFKQEYGRSKLNFNFFENRLNHKYKRLTISSSYSGYENQEIIFKDAFIHKLISNSQIPIEVQLYKNVITYLNGEYWGIHTIRERQDKYYLKSLYPNIKLDSLDLITGRLETIEGSTTGFDSLLTFIQNNDLSINENYNKVLNLIEIENYIDYFIIETYFGNQDWPSNNMKIWRERGGVKKWRWILYDVNFDANRVDYNPFITFENHYHQGKMFLSLIQNEQFKTLFSKRYVFFLKHIFKYENSKILLNNMKDELEGELENQINRWNNPFSEQKWENDCDTLLSYLKERNCQIKQFVIELTNKPEILNLYNCKKTTDLNNETTTIYPNPTNNYFTLKINHHYAPEGLITIYDKIGRRIKQVETTYSQTKVNVEELKNGIYLVNFKSETISSTKKLIIQK